MVTSEIAEQRRADDAAWQSLSRSVHALDGAVRDRDSGGDLPHAVEDDTAGSLQQLLESPETALLSPTQLSRRLNEGMPKAAVAIVNDFRSLHH